jgi:hypothetical protein
LGKVIGYAIKLFYLLSPSSSDFFVGLFTSINNLNSPLAIKTKARSQIAGNSPPQGGDFHSKFVPAAGGAN